LCLELEADQKLVMSKEEFYGKTVEVADREFVEQEADRILEGAETEDVSFLVVGDPFGLVRPPAAQFQPS
jgi:diphthine synthase